MENSLTDTAVVQHYQQEHQTALKDGSDKIYPNLSLVRIVGKYFEKKSGRLLDYGCGFGSNLIHLLNRGHTIDALDTSPYAIQKIKNKLMAYPVLAQNVALHVLSPEAARLPFTDETFDYIVCASVLSLLSSPDRIKCLLNEFRRVLRVSGKIYLDINGPESEFADQGQSLGKDIFKLPGKNGMKDRLVYCPSTPLAFRRLVEPYFTIDEEGFSAHRFLGYREQEFIICGRRC